MKNTAYTNLANWFEELNDDCDYENWSQYLILKLKQYPLKTGLDVGCGGGYFTRAFTKAGFTMTGLDVSPEMLDFAQNAALKAGVRSEYLLGDIASIKLPKRFDFVTAINDCFNYVPKTKLITAFKNVGRALKKDGIFLFDVSSERKFREKIANTVCADDREHITYLAFNKTDEEKTTMDVTLFVKRADGAFERYDETHVQYIHTETEICEALEKSGFSVISVEGHLGEEKEKSDRICFLAKKE